MSHDPLANAPDVHQDFSNAGREPEPLQDVAHDAEHWEPWSEHEEPSEKHYTLDYTPGGTIEQEVHTEVDAAARTRREQAEGHIHDARDLKDEQELDFAGQFDRARRNEYGFDPESAREYEEWTQQQDAERFQDIDAMIEDMHRSHHEEDLER